MPSCLLTSGGCSRTINRILASGWTATRNGHMSLSSVLPFCLRGSILVGDGTEYADGEFASCGVFLEAPRKRTDGVKMLNARKRFRNRGTTCSSQPIELRYYTEFKWTGRPKATPSWVRLVGARRSLVSWFEQQVGSPAPWLPWPLSLYHQTCRHQ